MKAPKILASLFAKGNTDIDPTGLIGSLRRLSGNRLESLRLIRFLIVGASGLVVNNLVLLLLTEHAGLHYLLSAAVATQCSTLWNFAFTEVWVFADRKSDRKPLGRLLAFLFMNNTSLAVRGPALAMMVSLLGFHYVLSNLISLFVIALLRYALSNRWIWAPPLDEPENGAYAYDIHDIVGIESWIRLPELEHFRVPKLDRRADIRLRQERRRKPRPADKAIRYNDGLGRYGFEVSFFLGEPTEVQVSALVKRSPHVLYTNVFEPLLRWTFVRKGYALVHAACVDYQGAAVLLTSRTDTGKTSTILQAVLNHNCAFLSDDMTILDPDGQVLSFPKPLTISAHSLKAARKASFHLKERLALQLQSRVHSRSGRRIALWMSRSGLPAATINALVQILIPPPKYMIERLIPAARLAAGARLSHVVHIERGLNLMQETRHEDIVEDLIRNAEDAYGFPPYPQLAGALSTWRGEDLHEREREIVREALRGLPALRLRNRSFNWWQYLPMIVKAYKPATSSTPDSIQRAPQSLQSPSVS